MERVGAFRAKLSAGRGRAADPARVAANAPDGFGVDGQWLGALDLSLDARSLALWVHPLRDGFVRRSAPGVQDASIRQSGRPHRVGHRHHIDRGHSQGGQEGPLGLGAGGPRDFRWFNSPRLLEPAGHVPTRNENGHTTDVRRREVG